MYRILAIGLCICLGGCGLSSSIMKSQTMAFDDVIEDTTNKLLLLNVLRARDKAPLHFADIPLIRESIQQSSSFSFLNFLGKLANTTVRDSTNIGASIQMTPSFEVNHLQSKEFNTGIASPIDAKFVKYWLDRGLDRRIVLLLFFSSVEIIETASEHGPISTIRIMNSPRDAIDVILSKKGAFEGPDESKCDTQSDFERYLKLINSLNTFFAHIYRERRLLAKGLSLEVDKDSRNLQGFAAMDQNKVQLVYDKGLSAYNVYALSPEPKVAFCFYEAGQSADPSSQYEFIKGGSGSLIGKNNCFQSVVEAPAEDSTRAVLNEAPVFFLGPGAVQAPSRYCGIYNKFVGIEKVTKAGGYPKLELRLHIRSVIEIFQFLGDLLQYQDEIQRHVENNLQLNLKLNSPVTFGYCGDKPTPACDDIFIRLNGDPCDARFTLTYRDKPYTVSNFSPSARQGVGCRSDYVARRDHTLEILAVLHQMVGLHKSAADLRATPFVQVLP